MAFPNLPQPPTSVPVINPVTHAMDVLWQNYFKSLQGISLNAAPVDAKYYVGTANATLTDDFNLGALSTGFLKITVAAGVATPSSASKIPLANGGTNADLSATGGTSQVLKQTSAGAAVTVGQLTPSDISGLNTTTTAYGAGSAYSFTNTAAAIDFGTTDPAIVLTAAGTYLLLGQVNLAYNGATVVAETATIKIRRTNNTAADVSAVVVLDLPAATTVTNTYGIFQIPPVVYTTTNTDDALALFGNVSAALGAGTIDATAIGTSLVAMRIQ